MLLGRPSLNALRVVPSAYHMVIKFPTENGVGVVLGDQRVGRECYSESIKHKSVKSVHTDELDMRDKLDTRPTPLEELEPVQLDDQPEHLAYIGSKLVDRQRPPHPLLKAKFGSIRLEARGHGRN